MYIFPEALGASEADIGATVACHCFWDLLVQTVSPRSAHVHVGHVPNTPWCGLRAKCTAGPDWSPLHVVPAQSTDSALCSASMAVSTLWAPCVGTGHHQDWRRVLSMSHRAVVWWGC